LGVPCVQQWQLLQADARNHGGTIMGAKLLALFRLTVCAVLRRNCGGQQWWPCAGSRHDQRGMFSYGWGHHQPL
jgi:hypothetical protein